MQEQFSIDGVQIKAPDTYKAVFATTSTEDSDRSQILHMNNTPMGTIEGYDMVWGDLSLSEAATIFNGMRDKPSFSFHYLDLSIGGWTTKSFYASNFTAEALSLKDGDEKWSTFGANVRSTDKL